MVGWAVDGSAKTMSLLRRKFKAAQLKAILAKKVRCQQNRSFVSSPAIPRFSMPVMTQRRR